MRRNIVVNGRFLARRTGVGTMTQILRFIGKNFEWNDTGRGLKRGEQFILPAKLIDTLFVVAQYRS
jgi:hypothetical protein